MTLFTDVLGHDVRLAEHGQPDTSQQSDGPAAVVPTPRSAGVSSTQVPQRRLHGLPEPALAPLRETPVRRLSRFLSLRLAPRTPRRPAARVAVVHRRQALRVRTVRPELPVQIRLRQAPRAKPSRQATRRQTVHVRRLRHAVPIPQVVQEASPQSHAREAPHEEHRPGSRPSHQHQRSSDRPVRRNGSVDEEEESERRHDSAHRSDRRHRTRQHRRL